MRHRRGCSLKYSPYSGRAYVGVLHTPITCAERFGDCTTNVPTPPGAPLIKTSSSFGAGFLNVSDLENVRWPASAVDDCFHVRMDPCRAGLRADQATAGCASEIADRRPEARHFFGCCRNSGSLVGGTRFFSRM